MPRLCPLTGKKTRVGRTYAIRGISKKKKGIGLNITGKTKRRFHPNLIKKRFYDEENKCFITLRLSASAIRTLDKVGLQEIMRRMKKKAKQEQ